MVFLLVINLVINSKVNANVLDNAYEFNGHVYKIFDSNGMHWDDAKYFCSSMGGHLAIAETREENNFLKHLAKINKRENTRFGCYLGGIGDNKGFVRWINGKIILYSDWAKNQPQYNNDNFRLILDAWNDYKWSLIAKDSTTTYGYGIICEWDSPNNAHESNF